MGTLKNGVKTFTGRIQSKDGKVKVQIVTHSKEGGNYEELLKLLAVSVAMHTAEDLFLPVDAMLKDIKNDPKFKELQFSTPEQAPEWNTPDGKYIVKVS